MQRIAGSSGRSILDEELEKGEDEVVDPATKKVPEEAARRLEQEDERPGARMVAHEHELSEHSFWPVVLAFGLLVVGIGFVSNLIVAGAGAVIVMVAIVGWMLERWVA
jgi:hypothetical protein